MAKSARHSQNVHPSIEPHLEAFPTATWISTCPFVHSNIFQNYACARTLKFQRNSGYLRFYGDWRRFNLLSIPQQSSNGTQASVFTVQTGVLGACVIFLSTLNVVSQIAPIFVLSHYIKFGREKKTNYVTSREQETKQTHANQSSLCGLSCYSWILEYNWCAAIWVFVFKSSFCFAITRKGSERAGVMAAVVMEETAEVEVEARLMAELPRVMVKAMEILAEEAADPEVEAHLVEVENLPLAARIIPTIIPGHRLIGSLTANSISKWCWSGMATVEL
ncbi:hypothetical protein B0H13DRAFT_1909813 [Mycena leptocephala]|nr:hypothetical protein B0H13DRAFT_1909813 [Mycena leptocephala]